jgi:hypothetical protein
MRVMIGIVTAQLVLFDEKNMSLLFMGYSPAQGRTVRWEIQVTSKNAHIFDYLEDLGEL